MCLKIGQVKKIRRRKWITRTLIAAPFMGALFVWGTNQTILSSADGKIFTDTVEIPQEPVALVLGTAPTLKNGNKNLFFERRMDAAARLYLAGKTKKLLVSGDNGSIYYDEPTAMKKALIQRGVPEKDIVLDYAGFSTLDSVVRAHRVFGVKECAIVTDDFHLARALYIAEHEGLKPVGFQTVPLSRQTSQRTYIREVGCRTQTWLDLHVLNRQPKFLGPKETL